MLKVHQITQLFALIEKLPEAGSLNEVGGKLKYMPNYFMLKYSVNNQSKAAKKGICGTRLTKTAEFSTILQTVFVEFSMPNKWNISSTTSSVVFMLLTGYTSR